jgi:hypothetical protein
MGIASVLVGLGMGMLVRVIWFISLATARRAGGEEAPPKIAPDLVLERFSVANNGSDLLVPLTIAGKDCLFVVDTGASMTVFDTSLVFSPPVDVVIADGAEGKAEVKLYGPPEARIGRLPIRPLEAVAGVDLKPVRQITGYPVYGLLGMDFLGRHVIHMDPESGEFLILKSAPVSADQVLPVSWEPGGIPYVVAEMAPDERIRFAVDTGRGGFDSGDLGVLEVRSLVALHKLRKIGDMLSETISGSRANVLYQGGPLRIGDFVVQSPIFGESHGAIPNRLGRGFWSRFAVTFDFPGKKIYLSKAASYGRPDRWNATGLHLWRRHEAIEVHSVDQDSPAARAGFRSGDELIQLDGLRAEKSSVFDLYKALCKGGKLSCVILRGSQERRLTISSAR